MTSSLLSAQAAVPVATPRRIGTSNTGQQQPSCKHTLGALRLPRAKRAAASSEISSSAGFTLRAGRRFVRPMASRAKAAPVAAAAPSELAVMVNSCTGKMGNSVAGAVVKAGLTLVPFSLNALDGIVAVEGVAVQLVPPEGRLEVVQKVRQEYPNLIVVDYTLPDVVTTNCEFYAEQGLNFVVGTTGGDRERMHTAAEAAGVYAVIAPNMGKQIVAVQAMVEMLAERFPGAFNGYNLSVVESHQKTKKDTSGTAKAVVESMGTLGCNDFKMSDIDLVRDEDEANSRLGVPMEAMSGHAFHTYTLTSPQEDVQVVLQHNVVGRNVYAEGTVDACMFLAQQAQAGAEKKIYNMIDVLESGFMR